MAQSRRQVMRDDPQYINPLDANPPARDEQPFLTRRALLWSGALTAISAYSMVYRLKWLKEVMDAGPLTEYFCQQMRLRGDPYAAAFNLAGGEFHRNNTSDGRPRMIGESMFVPITIMPEAPCFEALAKKIDENRIMMKLVFRHDAKPRLPGEPLDSTHILVNSNKVWIRGEGDEGIEIITDKGEVIHSYAEQVYLARQTPSQMPFIIATEPAKHIASPMLRRLVVGEQNVVLDLGAFAYWQMVHKGEQAGDVQYYPDETHQELVRAECFGAGRQHIEFRLKPEQIARLDDHALGYLQTLLAKGDVSISVGDVPDFIAPRGTDVKELMQWMQEHAKDLHLTQRMQAKLQQVREHEAPPRENLWQQLMQQPDKPARKR